VVVVLSLMPDRKNGDRLLIIDFEQGHVSRGAERDKQLAQEWIRIFGFAARERKFLED
jgi:hypothetical protein